LRDGILFALRVAASIWKIASGEATPRAHTNGHKSWAAAQDNKP